MEYVITASEAQRFVKGVEVKEDRDSCWLWTRSTKGFGYGQILIGGLNTSAHRVAWAYWKNDGELPDSDTAIRHSCDIPRCCNPSHLIAGTQKENLLDMRRKGRANDPSGEDSGKAVLTNEQAEEIRRRYEPYSRTNGTRALGREFGVSHPVISNVVNNKTY